MRRMYTEQQLTAIIKEVFEAELASGALDEKISDAVDAYLVENPVDITALEGLDISVGSLDADGLVTGAEIVEKMSGYTMVNQSIANITKENVYGGVVKNGNKLTIVYAFNVTRTAEVTAVFDPLLSINIPSAIGSKLYPAIGSATLARQIVYAVNTGGGEDKELNISLLKNSGTNLSFNVAASALNALTSDTKYYIRVECTFLLSDNMLA